MTTAADFTTGFRVVGGHEGDRVAVSSAVAFAAYAACHPKAECRRPAYLSAFTFGSEFHARIGPGGRVNVRGFDGPCFAPFVWFDIDRGDIPTALLDTRRLVGCILDVFPALDDDAVLVFFSGSKGFHVGLPVGVTGAAPSADFHRRARSFALALADKAGVRIDTAIYDRARLLRAPNSPHPKSNLFKRCLSHEELMGLSADRILQLATEPAPFDVPPQPAPIPAAVALWNDSAPAHHTHAGGGDSPRVPRRLQRGTVEYIRGIDSPAEGNRNVRLYSAAANLLEHGTPLHVVRDLLTGPARDSGLPPAEIEKAVAAAAQGVTAARGAT